MGDPRGFNWNPRNEARKPETASRAALPSGVAVGARDDGESVRSDIRKMAPLAKESTHSERDLPSAAAPKTEVLRSR